MSDFDPVTLEVYWQRLISIAEEQALTLTRTAFSSQAGEMEDISSGVFDTSGRMIAQGVTGTVGVIAALIQGVPEFLKQYPAEALALGDMLISNDPWLLAGHLNDIAILAPVFRQDRLIGFTATMSHATDIGGKVWSSEGGEIYEEGIWIPPMKLYRQGVLQDDLMRLLEKNVRVPDQVLGDLMAQVTACNVGAEKVIAFCAEERLDSLDGIADAILARSEQAVRQRIARIPPGMHTNEVLMDGFDEPLRIAVALTIEDDEILVDFAGSSAQVPYAMNCVYNYTLAHTVYAIKCVVCPEVPNNHGCFRPIRLECPEGLLLNAQPPAPVVSRHLASTFINAAVLNALAEAVPQSAIAESGSYGMPVLSGADAGTGRPFVYWFLCNGGMGARPDKDGLNTASFPANIATVSAEIVENVSPLSVTKKGLITDSGGAGKFRGGCGSELILSVRGSEPVSFSPVYERCEIPAEGVMGGLPGAKTELSVDGKPIHPKKKIVLQPGQVFCAKHAGGGGFHPPEERDVERVLDDVRNGYVSRDAASRLYKRDIDQADPLTKNSAS